MITRLSFRLMLRDPFRSQLARAFFVAVAQDDELLAKRARLLAKWGR